MNNVYYNPEHFGLTPVAELELSSGPYEYDTIVVWRTSDGDLVYAEDCGCSCPVPFEDHNLTTLEPIRDFHAFRAHVLKRAEWVAASAMDVIAFLDTVERAR